MRCIILDDEPLAREGIEILIKQIPELILIGSFGDADIAAEFMLTNSVDLLFLDIQMPEVNGIEFAKKLSDDTSVIFTTAYSNYALDSYEVDAIDYLVKPISIGRFKKAVEKAQSYYDLLRLRNDNFQVSNIDSDSIFVKSGHKFFNVSINDILYIEGLKDYVVLHMEGQKIVVNITMKSILSQMPDQTFIQVNKSYIINIKQIDSFDSNDIVIKGHEISIGSSYRSFFFEKILSKKILRK